MTARRMAAVVGTVVMVVAVFVMGVDQRSARAASSVMWGVDTISTTSSSFIGEVDTDLGTPQFVGRYLVWGGGSELGSAEASFLHSDGLPILLIVSPANSSLTSSSVATSEADEAISEAHKLGVPAGVALFRDVESSYKVASSYIETWYATIAAAGYVPGFYENPLSASSGFDSAYCSAVAANAAIASGMALYADEPELSSYTYTRASMPDWSAETPGCANTTVAWQYREGDTTPNVDVDEYLSRYASYLWSAGDPPAATTSVAIQDATHNLTTWDGAPATTGLGTAAPLGMASGTSPAVTSLGNGEDAVAFQANTGVLWTWVGDPNSTGSAESTGLAMAPGTSPAITYLGDGKVAVAFQANTGDMTTWTGSPDGSGSATSARLGMAGGTSPAITYLGDGKVAVAFQANTTMLWTWNGTPATTGSGAPTSLSVAGGTNPAD